MGVSLVAARSFSASELKSFVLACINDIAEDNTSDDVITASIDPHKDCWLVIGRNGFALGAVQFKPFNQSLLEIHPFIPKPNRNLSEKLVATAIAWVKEVAPSDMYQTLITNIPAEKRYARIFALKMGFKEVGRYSNGFKLDGKYQDMVLFERGINNE
jgi:hypothetical protein